MMISERSYRSMLGITIFYLLISSVIEVNGKSYDYGFNPECLSSPPKPQYGGGIVVNSELNEEGLNGWSSFGDANLSQRVSEDGNKFIVASDRNGSQDSFSQSFVLQKGNFYVISAWLQVSHGKSLITAAFKTPAGNISHAGTVLARSGCWSMLKGGITPNASGAAQLYFLSEEDATVDIWADSISLQPFTQQEWISHQIQSTDKVRKSKVRFQAVDPQGHPLPGVHISIKQLANSFPIGNAINANILTNPAYQSWFTSRFKVTSFENEMKWYSNEKSPGQEDYSASDSLLKFAQSHGIKVRGHNILWNDATYNPGWVKALSPADLQKAADKRVQSITQRYKGQVIHWDVVNENLHFNFLESKLGRSASATFYQKAHQIDPTATLFLNDYNTLEDRRDLKVSPASYVAKVAEMKSQGYNGPLGIGLEGHFNTPDLAYIRSSLDFLASKNPLIWVTELDINSNIPSQAQAKYLDQVLRELIAHPGIKGIVLWNAWSPQGCWRMCLTDNNFKNLPTGDVVDKILAEHKQAGLNGTTDANGYFETSLFHGDYEVKVINNPDYPDHMISSSSSSSHSSRFNVGPARNQSMKKINIKIPSSIS